jgi:hypothetical protein
VRFFTDGSSLAGRSLLAHRKRRQDAKTAGKTEAPRKDFEMHEWLLHLVPEVISWGWEYFAATAGVGRLVASGRRPLCFL